MPEPRPTVMISSTARDLPEHRQEVYAACDRMGMAPVMMEDVWELAEVGPYPLEHADAYNVLTQIECDAGDKDAAIYAATRAYELAWCDGSPYAYHYGLQNARAHLSALGAPEPELPLFDESQFEPMVEVEIDPEDEFHVGDSVDGLLGGWVVGWLVRVRCPGVLLDTVRRA